MSRLTEEELNRAFGVARKTTAHDKPDITGTHYYGLYSECSRKDRNGFPITNPARALAYTQAKGGPCPTDYKVALSREGQLHNPLESEYYTDDGYGLVTESTFVLYCLGLKTGKDFYFQSANAAYCSNRRHNLRLGDE